jgi:hypothetical protein
MRQEPKMGPGVRIVCAVPSQGRVRPEEILRRKLMQKMMARRERRAAELPPVRRAV